MTLQEQIAMDFECILNEKGALAAELVFFLGTQGEKSVKATVSEIDVSAELIIGGFKPARAFSATVLTSDFLAGAFPCCGDRVQFGGKIYRVAGVATAPDRALTTITFTEKS